MECDFGLEHFALVIFQRPELGCFNTVQHNNIEELQIKVLRMVQSGDCSSFYRKQNVKIIMFLTIFGHRSDQRDGNLLRGKDGGAGDVQPVKGKNPGRPLSLFLCLNSWKGTLDKGWREGQGDSGWSE